MTKEAYIEKMKAFYSRCLNSGSPVPCPRCGKCCGEPLVPSRELEGWYVCPSCAARESQGAQPQEEWVVLKEDWQEIITLEEIAEVRKALDEIKQLRQRRYHLRRHHLRLLLSWLLGMALVLLLVILFRWPAV